jgi:hypothetical protein
VQYQTGQPDYHTPPIDDRSLVNTYVVRVEIQPEQLVIQLAQARTTNRQMAGVEGDLYVRWQKPISTRRR